MAHKTRHGRLGEPACSWRLALRAYLLAKRLRLRPLPDDPLRIELGGARRRRYEAVHGRKFMLYGLATTKALTTR